MIDVTNYFLCSTGEFKALPYGYVEKLYAARWSKDDVVLGNHVFHKNFSSVSSWYWVSEDEKYLVRLSDHWTAGSLANNCGSIRSCHWTLQGVKAAKRVGLLKGRHGYQRTAYCAGIIAFADMR